MSPTYDAIVVGARCAGSPCAMLLARMGHRVLQQFPRVPHRPAERGRHGFRGV